MQQLGLNYAAMRHQLGWWAGGGPWLLAMSIWVCTGMAYSISGYVP